MNRVVAPDVEDRVVAVPAVENVNIASRTHANHVVAFSGDKQMSGNLVGRCQNVVSVSADFDLDGTQLSQRH